MFNKTFTDEFPRNFEHSSQYGETEGSSHTIKDGEDQKVGLDRS